MLRGRRGPLWQPDLVSEIHLADRRDCKLLTGSDDGTAQLWHAPTVIAGDPRHFVLWAQVVTGMEIREKTSTIEFLDAPAWRARRRQLDAMGGPPSP